MKFKFFVMIAVCIGLAAALAGCDGNGEQLKQDVLQAAEKNKGINNYTFSGSATVRLPSLSGNSGTGSPLDAMGIAAMLANSSVSWEGTASRNPVRLEADLRIGQGDGPATLELPIRIKDNSLYFQIPGASREDEFFRIDMDELSRVSQQANPLSPEMLKNAGSATTDILKFIVDAVDPKWFVQAKPTSDNKGKTVISVELNQDNIGGIALSLFEKFPSAMDELQRNGLISADQANAFKKMADDQALNKLQDALKQIKVERPGQIVITIDEQGYIAEQRIDLDYTLSSAPDSTYQIHVQSKMDQIDQNPEFKQPIPENARSFDEVLQLLNSLKP